MLFLLNYSSSWILAIFLMDLRYLTYIQGNILDLVEETKNANGFKLLFSNKIFVAGYEFSSVMIAKIHKWV